jgi:hypothetical protein
VKRKIASRENKIFKNFRFGCGSFPAVAAMTRATATRQRNAIRAQNCSGNFLRIKTAATLARRVFIDRNGWFDFHNF